MTEQLDNAELHAIFFGTEDSPNHNGWLGFTISHSEHGRIEADMVVRRDHLNPMDGLHGGVSASFADSLAGYGVLMSKPEECIGFATVNLHSSYFGIAAEGEVLNAEATLVRGGRQVQVWDIVVTCDERQIVDVRVTQLLRYPK